jgi:hypothetical protein
LTVVGLVGGHDERRSRRIQDFFDDLAVVDLSTSDDEVQWSTLAIDDRMDFRGPPTTTDANRLIFLPPFAPLAARCAFTIVLSIKYKLSRDAYGLPNGLPIFFAFRHTHRPSFWLAGLPSTPENTPLCWAFC